MNPTHDLKHYAFLRRVLLGFVAGANLVFLGFAAYSVFDSYQDHEAQARRQVQGMAQSLQRNIDDLADKIHLTLQATVDELQHELGGKGVDEKFMTSYLPRLQGRVPQIEAIRIADARGLVILGQGVDKARGITWSDRDYFIHHMTHADDAMLVTKPRLGRTAKQYIVNFSMRYNHPDGRFAGVVSAPVSVAYLQTLTSAFDVGANGMVSLRDQDLGRITGAPLHDDRPAEQVGSKVISDATLAALTSGQASVAYTTTSAADGVTGAMYVQRLKEVPFIVTVGLARKDYLANWYEEIYRMLVLVLLFGLASVLAWRRLNTLLDQGDQLQTKVEEHEARWKVAMDRIGEGFWEWNMATGEMPRSRAFDAALGYSEQELPFTADAWVQLIHPEDLERNTTCLQNHLAGGDKYAIEMRVRAKDGSYRWIACRGAVVARDAKGAPTRMSGMHTDITERRQQEEQLKLLAKVVAEANDMVVITEAEPKDPPGPRIVFVNDAFERVTGFSREEAIGNTPRMLQGPQSDRAALDRIRNAMKKWQPVHEEVLNYTKDGREFWSDLQIYPLANASGWYTHWIAIQRDITEAKRNQILLATKERELQLLIDSVPAMIGYWDNNLINHYGNQAYGEWFAIDSATMPGMHIRDVIGEERYEANLPYIEAALRGQRQRFEREIPTPEGRMRYAQAEYVPDVQKGVVRGFYAVVFDVSELKQTQLELMAARDAAQAASVAKSQFLATMSHELRTPLNGIMGNAQLLMMDDVREGDRVDYAHTVLTSGQTLLVLINDILDLAKIEAGKLELESIKVSPLQIMAHAQELFSQAAHAKGLQISTDWRGPRASYLGDSHRLTQMLSNLVSNAVKFTAQGRIRIEGAEVDARGSTATLEFSVIDTGIGIARDKFDKLFQSFSQVDSSTTRQYGGTGLGLSIVRTLAQLMGGEAGAQSELGHGSRFWFRIQAERVAAQPATPEALRTAQLQARVVRSAQSARVLLVEDNPDHQRLTGALLERLGLNVAMAENGQQALDLIAQGDKAQVILMDLNMPVLDGYAATQQLRKWERNHGEARRTIVALTANAFEHDRRSCLAAGMDEVLTKPVSFDQLHATLARWLPELVDSLHAEKLLDAKRVRALLQELYPMLATNQVDAIARFKELQDAVADTPLALPVAQAGEALQNFEFEAALAQLQSLEVP